MKKQPPMRRSGRVLIVNPFGIGDVLFTTPVMRALKEHQPGCEVWYWCNERVQDLFRHHPDVSGVFALSRGDLKRIGRRSGLEAARRFWGLLRGLQKARFDAAFDFSLDHRYSCILALLRVKRRIGFDYRGRGRFLTDKLTLTGYHDKHMAEYYLDLLDLIGVPAAVRKFSMHVTQSAGADTSGRMIGIAGGAGASWGRDAGLKHWPAVKFAQLCDAVSEHYKAQIVLLGDASEKPIAEVISSMARCKPFDLVGETTLPELGGVMTFLDLLVSNDGGPLHMAVALGLKTVSIFGPVDARVYGPYPVSPDHRVITYPVECRPCYRDFRMPVCGRERACIKLIGVQDVFQAVREVLQ